MKHLSTIFVVAGAILVLAFGLFATEAPAQTLQAGSASQSQSSSSVYSHNGSYSGAQIINNAPAEVTHKGGYDNKTTYGGRYEVTNTPSVSVGGVVTAHNCALGAGVGLAGPGAGLSISGTRIDENCEIISQAAALNTLAGAKAALHHMAQIPKVCRTLRATGKIAANSVCPDDPKRKPVKSSKSNAVAPAPALTWKVCEKRGNQVYIKYKHGKRSPEVKRACLQSLGYGG